MSNRNINSQSPKTPISKAGFFAGIKSGFQRLARKLFGKFKRTVGVEPAPLGKPWAATVQAENEISTLKDLSERLVSTTPKDKFKKKLKRLGHNSN